MMPTPNEPCYIHSRLNGKVLDVFGASTQPNAHLIIHDKKPSHQNIHNQVFAFTSDGTIVCCNTGLVLDVEQGNWYSGARLITNYKKYGPDASSQMWSYDPREETIKSVTTGYVLDVWQEARQNGAHVVVHHSKGFPHNTNQRWFLSRVEQYKPVPSPVPYPYPPPAMAPPTPYYPSSSPYPTPYPPPPPHAAYPTPTPYPPYPQPSYPGPAYPPPPPASYAYAVSPVVALPPPASPVEVASAMMGTIAGSFMAAVKSSSPSPTYTPTYTPTTPSRSFGSTADYSRPVYIVCAMTGMVVEVEGTARPFAEVALAPRTGTVNQLWRYTSENFLVSCANESTVLEIDGIFPKAGDKVKLAFKKPTFAASSQRWRVDANNRNIWSYEGSLMLNVKGGVTYPGKHLIVWTPRDSADSHSQNFKFYLDN